MAAWMVKEKQLHVLDHGSSESDTKLLGSLVGLRRSTRNRRGRRRQTEEQRQIERIEE
jgi:hypothetical protein